MLLTFQKKMADIFLIFLAILFMIWYIKSWMHPKDYPPGPRLPLPFIGDGYIFGTDIITGLQKIKKKYGPTCGFWLGNQRCVLLTDFDLIQDAMNKPETAARQQVAAASELNTFSRCFNRL